MKIRVLHILHSLNIGGLENGVVNLLNRLDDKIYEHEVCCITTTGPMGERFAHSVNVHEMGKGDGKDYFLAVRLAGLIREIRPDIVHTRNWGTIDGIIGARLAGVNRVVHGEHGREAIDPTGANRRRRIFRRLLAPAVSRFVTVSADLEDWLVQDIGVPRSKVEHIINGVDCEKFRPQSDNQADRSKLGIPPGKTVLGIVGRLDPVKDHATLLRALARTNSSCHLIVVGSGPLDEDLRGLARELGVGKNVSFLGARDDIADILKSLDIFVLPSVAEGISNTILEAMACGLPVVASRVGGNPELVADGETGVLFEAGDVEALAEKIGVYADNSEMRRRHGAAARARAEREFSLETMVARYDRLYRSLV